MPVRFLCPACHQLLSIATRKVGSEVDCPKCRSTIIVPDPNHHGGREESNPFEQVGLEQALSDITAGRKSASNIAPQPPLPTSSLSAAPLLHEPAKNPPADDSLIMISRRVLYLQAALLAVVAVVAFVCGFLIGGGR